MSRIAVVTQSNYVPWRGWFEMIAQSDIWVIYDNVQFTKRDWRNRNIIRVNESPEWLTIPVNTKGKYKQLICETEISNSEWFTVHKQKLSAAYSNFPHYHDLSNFLNHIDFLIAGKRLLSDVNEIITRYLLEILGIAVEIVDSRNYNTAFENSSERLLEICKQVNADIYLSGPAAKDYLDSNMFLNSGIDLAWMDYSKLPTDLDGKAEAGEYSILDLIARKGFGALREYLPSCVA